MLTHSDLRRLSSLLAMQLLALYIFMLDLTRMCVICSTTVAAFTMHSSCCIC